VNQPVRRRVLLAGTAAGAAVLRFGAGTAFGATPRVADGVPLRWLDGVPATTTGTGWGVPWPRGAVPAGTAFALTTSAGAAVPVQSWPLAYWPDGTLKWTGHCVGADAGLADGLRLAPGTPAAPAAPVTVRRDGHDIVLANGTVEVRVATSGSTLLRTIRRGDRDTARDGRLVLNLQDQPDDGPTPPRRSTWSGAVDGASIEQSGPVRGTVKLTGHYAIDRGQPDHGNGDRRLFPWTLRIYLGTGAESLRLVHSFVWDGDPAKDFVKGLGLRLSVPMTDETHNRHIRFAGKDDGVWGEPVRVLTGLRRDPGIAVRRAQVAGTATPPVAQWAATVQAGYQALPQWSDFRLFQDSAVHFSVAKRTGPAATWLTDAAHGDRAPGLGYVGGVSGGLGFGLRDFWQRYPRALDISGAAGDNATVTLWSWAPTAAAMDMRPYDAAGHGLDLAYEDNRDGWGDPRGISRSTDTELWAFAATPARDRFAALAAALATGPQLLSTPEVYHAAGVFGRWSLPDRSTPARAALEDAVAATVSFYADEIERRSWYGFWDHGDVMHTYDADRHTWRYDQGGYAWDNAELGTDAMLWYAFLRSGDPRTFHLARALTRHVSEVDTYVAGRFAGIGSRHNVLHWGDGAKEARVAESYTRRFLLYLTADELLGDLIRASLQADHTLLTYEPLRDVLPPQTVAPSRLRIGPDWYALVSNWLTEWERTGNTHWRDRIVVGMRDIATFPAGLFTGEGGGAVGYDPATGHLVNLEKGDFTGGYNLAMAFCGDQVMFETVDLVDVPEFRQTLLDFARYVQAPSAEKITHYGHDFNPGVFPTIYSRVTAWAGEQLNDSTIRQRGWTQYLGDPSGRPWPAPVAVGGSAVLNPIQEIPAGDFSTNDAAQRGLAIIELLAIAPGEAP
jgi:hypothetical protein